MLAEINRPIFVFGCSNSGTTILWQGLKQHNRLSGPDIEGQDLAEMPRIMTHFLGRDTFRLWAHPKFKLCYYVTEADYTEEDAMEIRRVYNKYIEPETRLIAKGPADTLRARLIQAYFPDACFIAIVRNGYAVCEGIIRKRKYDHERPQYKGLLTTIKEAAEQWLRANFIIVSHQKFLRNYKIIRYEDLVRNPQKVLTSLLAFCGLNKEGFQIPKYDTERNNEQLVRLSKRDIETITRICGPMLIHFDYELSNKGMERLGMDSK